ncbi:MAG: D-2-hydroxyacid dehydrogenase [Eubacteriales bacterium]|nr:D-2-hydroxyacid dehydrogenase [Eubacteriales bacterium]
MQPDLPNPTILVTIPMTPNQRRELESQASGHAFVYTSREALQAADVAAADIILGNVPPALLTGAQRLRWIQLNSAGSNDYAKPGILPEGTQLTNASGSYGLAISEHMLGFCLMLIKKLHLYRDNQSRALWHDEGPVTSIASSTTLVIGLGDIGSQFASRMQALGSTVLGIRRMPAAGKPDFVASVHGLDELDELLPQADFVALTLPETPQTIHLINRERLALMKPGTVLVNVGRGNAIETEALCDALAAGHLGGAGLDVTDPEPLPADHRLWSLPNVLITPHVSGFYHLQATLDSIVALATRNLGHFMRGEQLENVVDRSTGYRMTQVAAAQSASQPDAKSSSPQQPDAASGASS